PEDRRSSLLSLLKVSFQIGFSFLGSGIQNSSKFTSMLVNIQFSAHSGENAHGEAAHPVID
ncbi:hypothetical protein, partial [Candidatus Cryptobacteroides sp.]|uniref:hypothetical protein n=1 Tax=Candidatus Cryptobacteroides sp. TaxID=2952915 RepID=UPI002A7EB8BE